MLLDMFATGFKGTQTCSGSRASSRAARAGLQGDPARKEPEDEQVNMAMTMWREEEERV